MDQRFPTGGPRYRCNGWPPDLQVLRVRQVPRCSWSIYASISHQQFQAGQFPARCRTGSRPVETTDCHCGDWKAPPCPIVIGSVSPHSSSIQNTGASWGETPLSPARSMLSGSQRMAVRARRRETRSWPVLLSLALHLTVFLALLIIPPTQPPTNASGPLTVDVILGPAGEPSAPTEATAAPVQQAEVPPPTPAPDVPPPPPVQQAEIPPPTPAPAPDVPPPPPVRQAEIRPPTPPPAPMPVPPPPQPVAQAHPPRAPLQRAAARAPANPAGAHAPTGQNAAGGASGGNNGAAWMGKLKQWWDQHSFYPKEASQTNEGGNVKVHIVIAPDGEVTSIEVVQGSGTSVLDAAAVAVFRNAHLPPFPPGTPAQPADVVVTLHYHPAE
jgi:periplasmic protein TonB